MCREFLETCARDIFDARFVYFLCWYFFRKVEWLVSNIVFVVTARADYRRASRARVFGRFVTRRRRCCCCYIRSYTCICRVYVCLRCLCIMICRYRTRHICTQHHTTQSTYSSLLSYTSDLSYFFMYIYLAQTQYTA